MNPLLTLLLTGARINPSVIGPLLVGSVGAQQAKEIQKDYALGNISLDDIYNIISNLAASPGGTFALKALKDKDKESNIIPFPQKGGDMTPSEPPEEDPEIPPSGIGEALDLVEKTKENLPPRDESSGMAADYVPPEYGPQAFDLTQELSEEFSPEGFSTFSTDVGDNYEYLRNFIFDSDSKVRKEGLEFINLLKKIKGDPEALITMYRAAPTDELREGDLLTPSKTQAQFYVDQSTITQKEIREEERKARLDTDEPIDLSKERAFSVVDSLMDIFGEKQVTPSKLFEYKIKAKDLRWDGGNRGITGWGYFPTDK
jgi:hypothetical protein